MGGPGHRVDRAVAAHRHHRRAPLQRVERSLVSGLCQIGRTDEAQFAFMPRLGLCSFDRSTFDVTREAARGGVDDEHQSRLGVYRRQHRHHVGRRARK
jgi:hypothetical protein